MYWTPLLFSHLAAAIFSDSRNPGAVLFNKTADSCTFTTPRPAECKTEWQIEDDLHPGSVLRIKKTDTKLGNVCHGAGAGHTGYFSFDHGKRNLYFVFFESQSKPLNDPVALWLQGGPGTSSLSYGLLSEHGPCLINDKSTKANPYSWNKVASVLYVDQPAGVGYSFSTSADPVSTAQRAAEDMVALLHLFYKAFPALKPLDFHITGESYAGKWIPWLGSEVVRANRKHPSHLIPLKFVVIGGGFFYPALQDPSGYDYACVPPFASGKALFNQSVCATLKAASVRCKALWAAYTQLNGPTQGSEREKAGRIAYDTCGSDMYVPVYQSGNDIYNMNRICPDKSGACDPKPATAEKFLQRDEVRLAFGADTGTFIKSAGTSTFHSNNDALNAGAETSGDTFKNSALVLADLLDSKIPALLYVGMHDYVVNYRGVESVLDHLAWSGSSQFKAAQGAPVTWAGGVKWRAKNLVYMRFHNAGHLVPEEDPANAFAMWKAWLDGSLLR
ncbi:Alpha/Beta hydrolase protein [Protomyces lactucae-debilis]|uniref:Carboxypeptidase n=1 Tax=Protomyces lactucae-debilis TaxID=2754530 RepID=A0A1Y2FIU4_PROLT|nr:Alpha/Beta hydrolase protein [Protomyces lactucae-debilis]ORY83853.1 Alpha/Beta hydrolase protein [Protomyces lactucae-debilis]